MIADVATLSLRSSKSKTVIGHQSSNVCSLKQLVPSVPLKSFRW